MELVGGNILNDHLIVKVNYLHVSGMGGQLEFFGLWLDAEYGKGRCAPSCTSYQSPQLSKEEHFKYEHLEVMLKNL